MPKTNKHLLRRSFTVASATSLTIGLLVANPAAAAPIGSVSHTTNNDPASQGPGQIPVRSLRQLTVGSIVQQLLPTSRGCVSKNREPVGITFPVDPADGEVDISLTVAGNCALVVTSVGHEGVRRKPGGVTAEPAPAVVAATADSASISASLSSCAHQGWSKATDIYGGFTAGEVKMTAAWASSGSDHGCYGTSVSSPVVVGGTHNTYCYANPLIQLSEFNGCSDSVGNYSPTSLTFETSAEFLQGVGATFGEFYLNAGVSNNYTYSGRFYSNCYVDYGAMPTGNSLHCAAALSY